MRTETEVASDIVALTADVNNLLTVAPPVSGTALTLQLLERKLSDAWKELATMRGSDPTADTAMAASAPSPELVGAAPSAGPAWFKKKK